MKWIVASRAIGVDRVFRGPMEVGSADLRTQWGPALIEGGFDIAWVFDRRPDLHDLVRRMGQGEAIATLPSVVAVLDLAGTMEVADA